MRKLVGLLLPLLVLASGCSTTNSAPETSAKAKRALSERIQWLAIALDKAAAELAPLTADKAALTVRLQSLLYNFPEAEDCAFVSPGGVMVALAPASYRHYEGVSIAHQPQFQAVKAKRLPLLSPLFQAKEGYQAFTFVWPVLEDGQFKGALSVLFRPGTFFRKTIEPTLKGGPFDLWVAQADGVVVYDRDAEEVGKNLLSDPAYAAFPALRQAWLEMVAAPEGETTYNSFDQSTRLVTDKEARWVSFAQYGVNWRLVLTRPVRE